MAIRAGFHTVSPYLMFENAAEAFEFYKKAFHAVEITVMKDDKGVLRHGELRVGDSPVMLSNVAPEFPEIKSVQQFGGSPMSLFLYVDDADALFNHAVSQGCSVAMAMDDKPYGRTGGVNDPYGYTWWITTHKE